MRIAQLCGNAPHYGDMVAKKKPSGFHKMVHVASLGCKCAVKQHTQCTKNACTCDCHNIEKKASKPTQRYNEPEFVTETNPARIARMKKCPHSNIVPNTKFGYVWGWKFICSACTKRFKRLPT